MPSERVIGGGVEYSTVTSAVNVNNVIYGLDNIKGGSNFFVFDIVLKKVIKNIIIESQGSWKILYDGHDSIYIAGYFPAILYRYDISTETMVSVLNLTELYPDRLHRFIWDIELGNGVIYMGTDNTPIIYALNILTSELREYKTPAFTYGFYRSLVRYGSKLYAGTGAESHLFEINLVTGVFTDIMPAYLTNTSGIYYVVLTGVTVFYNDGKSYDIYGFNVNTRVTRKYLTNGLLYPHPTAKKVIAGNRVFTAFSDLVYQFDGVNLSRTMTPQQPLVGIRGSGDVISGITRHGEYVVYDGGYTRVRTELSKMGLMAFPSRVFSMALIPNAVVTGGHKLRHRNFITNAISDRIVHGEPKVMAANSSHLYTANYTHASVWRYPIADLTNPNANFADPKYKYYNIPKQNRPTGIYVDSTRVLVTSEPEYGLYGGALTIMHYSGTKVVLVDMFKKHTPTSVVGVGNTAYITTSSTGGSFSVPLNQPGRLIKYDMVNKSVLYDKILDPTEYSLGSVCELNGVVYAVGSSGKLYRMDKNGIITSYNRIHFVKVKNIGGVLYGLARYTIVKIDPVTLVDTTLVTASQVSDFVVDKNKKLYWINENDMLVTLE